MPQITVSLPEPKGGLDGALAKQFTAIQKQLMGLVKSQQRAAQTMRSDFLTTMRRQHEDLTDALTQLFKAMPKSAGTEGTDALVRAIRDMRQAIQRMPKMAMHNGSAHTNGTVRPHVTVSPKVTVQMPNALVKRLDAMESSLLNGLRRSRSRTFGSNY